MIQKTKYISLGAALAVLFVLSIFAWRLLRVDASKSTTIDQIGMSEEILQNSNDSISETKEIANLENNTEIESQVVTESIDIVEIEPQVVTEPIDIIEIASQVVTEPIDTIEIEISNNDLIGTVDTPLRAFDSIIKIIEDLNAKHIDNWISGSGWYFYEFQDNEPNIADIHTSDSQPITSKSSITQNWLFVNDSNQITDRVLLSKDENGNILQEIVSLDGTLINLTGYDDKKVSNAAISPDHTYQQDIVNHSLVIELLKTLPSDADVIAWLDISVEPNEYVVFTTQNTGENPPVINFSIKFNYEIGNVILWEGGHTMENGDYRLGVRLSNFNFQTVTNFPKELEILLAKGNNILEEEK